nr:type I toxin-antitoxin system toxin Ldr family protein [Escherichia coli]
MAGRQIPVSVNGMPAPILAGIITAAIVGWWRNRK